MEKNCKSNFYVTCPVKVWLLQQLLVVHATEITTSPEHCRKNCHPNKEVRSHHPHSPWATLATRWNEYWLQNPVSCVQLCEWHSPPVPSETNTLLLPGRHLPFSTQSRLRIHKVDQGNNSKRFWVRAFSNVEVSALYSEVIIWRKLWRKTWRPTCSQRIRFAQTVHQWLFWFFCSKAQWACCCSMGISAIYKSSLSSSPLPSAPISPSLPPSWESL